MPDKEKESDMASLKKAIQEKVAARMDELGQKITALLDEYEAVLVAKAIVNDNGTLGAAVQLSPKQ